MPWKECDRMSQRDEFLRFYQQNTLSMSELCRRFGVSRKTGYKWVGRFSEGGLPALADQSRRPRSSPRQTPSEIEDLVVELRHKHPRWGGRKLRRRLLDLNYTDVPAASTITEILRRHGLLEPPERATRDFQRFEREEPNDLWQMDFKGHFATQSGHRCHPLTVLDDHSRFSLGIRAFPGERELLVRPELELILRTYGLPRSILCDHGPPWGCGARGEVTRLSVWLLKQGVEVIHGRPLHPQTQGKEERFHRSLKAEVLQERQFSDLSSCQEAFDVWRPIYNTQRPHEALKMQVPSSRYRPSPRSYCESPGPWDYGPSAIVRKVMALGRISFQGARYHVSRGLSGESVCLRPTEEDGVYGVFFCRSLVTKIDLREARE